VKKNMALLAEARRRTGAQTEVEVSYHRYLGNLDEEVLMRRLSTELGFTFKPTWAYWMPVEKYLSRGLSQGGVKLSTLSDQDLETIERFALPIKDALAVCKMYRKRPCPLRESQVTLNVVGEVMLCCGVYDASKFIIGNFLSSSIEELQELRHKAHICKTCMNEGVHVLLIYGAPQLDILAARNIARYYKEADIRFLDAAVSLRLIALFGTARSFLVDHLRRVPWLYQLARRVRNRVLLGQMNAR
jgi:hypothetical protein